MFHPSQTVLVPIRHTRRSGRLGWPRRKLEPRTLIRGRQGSRHLPGLWYPASSAAQHSSKQWIGLVGQLWMLICAFPIEPKQSGIVRHKTEMQPLRNQPSLLLISNWFRAVKQVWVRHFIRLSFRSWRPRQALLAGQVERSVVNFTIHSIGPRQQSSLPLKFLERKVRIFLHFYSIACQKISILSLISVPSFFSTITGSNIVASSNEITFWSITYEKSLWETTSYQNLSKSLPILRDFYIVGVWWTSTERCWRG